MSFYKMLSNDTIQRSCQILKSGNYSYISLGEGWEGLPASLLINALLCSCLILAFIIINSIVNYKRKHRKQKHEQKQNWLQFIYGQKDMKKTKYLKVNRKHAFAYLPPILYDYYNLITDKVEGEEIFDEELKAYSPNDKTEHEFKKPLKTKSNESLDLAMKSVEIDSNKTFPSMHSTTDQKSDNVVVTDGKKILYNKRAEDVQKDHLKSVLLGDDKGKESIIHKTHKARDFWLLDYFCIKDEDILRVKGSDALQYLLFQRYIIYFLSALTFISLLIILPINIAGKHGSAETNFFKTTVNNINPKSRSLWIHSIMTSMIVPMGYFMMIHFSELISVDTKRVDHKILLIEGIPKVKRNTRDLIQYFRDKFPTVVIKRINFVYDIRKLNDMKNSLLTAIEAKSFCFEYKKKFDERCEVRPYCLGRLGGFLGFCSCCPKIDGMLYYAEEKAELEKDIKDEVKKVLSHPKESVFITFERRQMAEQVYNHFLRKQLFCCNLCLELYHRIMNLFNTTDPFMTYKWRVFYAPYPEDIEWLDICLSHRATWFWSLFLNFILIIIFLFLTTPSVLVDFIVEFFPKDVKGNKMKIALNYLKSLILMSLTAILPAVVVLIQSQIPYRTKSALNHGIMLKTCVFLLLMVFILPSLGYLTGLVLLENFDTNTFRWECVFPTESSPFFVHYVLQSAFLANTFEMMRIPELSLYLLNNVIYSRSIAEYESARQRINFEFDFGSRYPRFLLIFTMITTYSISSPLIAPSGLLYFIYKHLVDRYLIFYVYTPSKINSRIHWTAVFFFNIGLLFLLIQVHSKLYGSKQFNNWGPYVLTFVVMICFIISLIWKSSIRCVEVYIFGKE